MRDNSAHLTSRIFSHFLAFAVENFQHLIKIVNTQSFPLICLLLRLLMISLNLKRSLRVIKIKLNQVVKPVRRAAALKIISKFPRVAFLCGGGVRQTGHKLGGILMIEYLIGFCAIIF